ncbi:tRNA (adenosine(37)-N6)-threonylcarbamoyltransferase complex transferase subunit TsaD [Gloeobacter kilaueensis]|uniref:tRNA N6-adenosine threonylcarbamoyltransferase n=1 Tax=Gloeobacter kilaueensis (strain ATCC BAA-2537 / CCAP 1431/1 / ULC 316 / JS1) TaxID=1183438 RepID=U5QQC6_GLOK1|nr:tRNA (adenosine(37)-N6)-threonylcarbamoyltransferase complex transferase subunit TsaD [Gloeobacter kilaueensis]AGY59880.1 DNA-binding/iron metalloprotein/AP endonuclease [Gloeobacter kilaueensis JS1]
MTTIFAIETSCDESAAAIVRGREVVASIIASQVDVHRRTGGVVPEVASREHLQALGGVVEACFADSGLGWQDIDAIAFTAAPGLVGSLLMGSMAAKTLALVHARPLIGIHHHEGHIYSAYLSEAALEPPFLCLLVSGGHTSLVDVAAHGKYRILGQTRDDAVGEAYDKVARLLQLGYPGGPAIDKLALTGNPRAFNLPAGRVESPYDTSFSGLKTAVLRLAEKHALQNLPLDPADLAASFQRTIVEALAVRVERALVDLGYRTVVVAGGVSANRGLRERLGALAEQNGWRAIFPPMRYCTDNAAMIACAGVARFEGGYRSPLTLAVQSRLGLEQCGALYAADDL